MWNFAHTCMILSAQIQEVVEDMSPVLVWGFMIVTTCAVIVDIFLYTNKVNGDTISNIIRDWVYGKWFVLSFVWGVMATHFFLTGPSVKQYAAGWMVIGLIVLVMILVGWLVRPRITPFTQAALLLFGVLASFVLTF